MVQNIAWFDAVNYMSIEAHKTDVSNNATGGIG